VTPTITDGGLGPTATLSQANAFTSKSLIVAFDDLSGNNPPEGTITYAGLAPGLAGLYQMNVVIPASAGTGNVYLQILTDAAVFEQVYIPITK
jgi:uncharacterized protein (TIGR03437 family)